METVFEKGNIVAFLLKNTGAFPNSRLPVLLFRREVEIDGIDPGEKAEQLLCGNGWSGTWQNGIYDFRHFHSNAHEALIIARGQVKIGLGGTGGPEFDISTGDALVLPAGTGHVNLGSSQNLLVVGGYPAGQEKYDICKGDATEHDMAVRKIEAVPLPKSDPIHGAHGVLLELWR